jgi:putative MFS transporter
MDKKRAVLFATKIFPFALNIAMIDFLIPIKYDVIADKLPLLGLLITFAWTASDFMDFIVGYLTDHVGVRKILQAGIIICFVGSLLFGTSDSLVIMTIGVFLWGLSYITMAVPSDTYVLSEFPNNYRGSAYGWLYFSQNIGYAIAPLMGYFLIVQFGMNVSIVMAAMIAVISFPLLADVKSDSKKMSLASGLRHAFFEKNMFKEILEDLGKMGFKQFSLLFNVFLSSFWFVVVLIGAPLLFFHADKDLFHGALLSFFFMLPFALTVTFYGRMADSPKRRKKMIILGLLLGAISLIIFYYLENINLLFISAFITTVLIYMGWSASEVEISNYLPDGEKAEYMGIYDTARDLGYDLAPLFYGLLAVINLKLPFFVVGVFMLGAGILSVFAHGRGCPETSSSPISPPVSNVS